MYSVVWKRPDRDALLDFLRTNGVDTRTMFCPMNMQPFLQKQAGYRHVPNPVAENLWTSGFYLPSSSSVTEADVQRIASLVEQFLAR
jgi:perosamine synthetase